MLNKTRRFVQLFFSGTAEKFSWLLRRIFLFPDQPKVARARGCPPILDVVRKSVRYLELTPPVAISANRKMRGHLKQRRCGPFCSLPAFHQPGLLKRHTFIAGSAVGIFPPIHGRQSELAPLAALVHHPRFAHLHGTGVSTGWFLSEW